MLIKKTFIYSKIKTDGISLDMTKQPKIAVIGAGVVGSTTAYTLKLKQIASQLILVDVNDIKCRGEVEDPSDTFTLHSDGQVILGTLKDAAQADIAIITAGIAQKPGQSRIDLLKTNHEIISSIINGMKPLNPALIIIMVTNPVDILTHLCCTLSGLPKSQIFGSGTLLDSWRLRNLISQKITIAAQSINLYILGEHGDSQFVAWSTATIAGKSLLEFTELKSQFSDLAQAAKNKAYSIIQCKGSTAFGIASCIVEYCQNIICDSKKVIPVSCFLKEFDICMSMPAVIGNKGVEKIIIPPFNSEEKLSFEKTIEILKQHHAI
ncbi:MAG: L-lactate dehydrogenase [Candidatus Dependentiae bacterium]|nr:L-lactate dehydrogenase [Candidatus Dependentiae bacterium]